MSLQPFVSGVSVPCIEVVHDLINYEAGLALLEVLVGARENIPCRVRCAPYTFSLVEDLGEGNGEIGADEKY